MKYPYDKIKSNKLNLDALDLFHFVRECDRQRALAG